MGLLLTNPLKRTYIYHINTAFIGRPLLFLTQYVLQHLCFVGCYIQIDTLQQSYRLQAPSWKLVVQYTAAVPNAFLSCLPLETKTKSG